MRPSSWLVCGWLVLVVLVVGWAGSARAAPPGSGWEPCALVWDGNADPTASIWTCTAPADEGVVWQLLVEQRGMCSAEPYAYYETGAEGESASISTGKICWSDDWSEWSAYEPPTWRRRLSTGPGDPGGPADAALDWSDPAHVLQAILWALSLFFGLHGYSQGVRT